jgi:hypothetical protein
MNWVFISQKTAFFIVAAVKISTLERIPDPQAELVTIRIQY